MTSEDQVTALKTLLLRLLIKGFTLTKRISNCQIILDQWDQTLLADLEDRVNKCINSVKYLSEIKVPKYYGMNQLKNLSYTFSFFR